MSAYIGTKPKFIITVTPTGELCVNGTPTIILSPFVFEDDGAVVTVIPPPPVRKRAKKPVAKRELPTRVDIIDDSMSRMHTAVAKHKRERVELAIAFVADKNKSATPTLSDVVTSETKSATKKINKRQK